MNEVYQSGYQQPVYTPIYQPNIIFTEEEEDDVLSDIAEA